MQAGDAALLHDDCQQPPAPWCWHAGPGGLQLSSAHGVRAPLGAPGCPGAMGAPNFGQSWGCLCFPTAARVQDGVGEPCSPTGRSCPVWKGLRVCIQPRTCVYMYVCIPVVLRVSAHMCQQQRVPAYRGRSCRVGAETAVTSKMFPSFSPQGAGGVPTGGDTLPWDGAGEGRAGGALPAPPGGLSSQPASRLFFLLPAGKLRQRPAQVTTPTRGHPPRVTAARHR